MKYGHLGSTLFVYNHIHITIDLDDDSPQLRDGSTHNVSLFKSPFHLADVLHAWREDHDTLQTMEDQ